MGGSAIDYDWEFPSPPWNVVSTVILVGRTGNGKSSTGNSILGRSAFVSEPSSAGVTSTCELQRTVLENGHILNVIDTPGLFDFSAELERTGKEIVKCIDMAKDGIHAVLMVLSVRSRFSREEEAAIESLRKFFGSKISDYMIVIFTGGDDLMGKTLDDYLGRGCPEPLKKIYLNSMRSLIRHMKSSQLKRITEMVESKLRETTHRLEQQLAEEHAARLKAEATAQASQEYSNEEIRKLMEKLEKAQKETEDIKEDLKNERNRSNSCAIL